MLSGSGEAIGEVEWEERERKSVLVGLERIRGRLG